jgi:hypothetical protein
MNLRDLKPSFISLPSIAQQRIVEPIRISRQVSKAPRTKAIKKKREKKVVKRNLLSNITPAQAQAILDKLKKDGNLPDNIKEILK